jgi:hypothetical protein
MDARHAAGQLHSMSIVNQAAILTLQPADQQVAGSVL